MTDTPRAAWAGRPENPERDGAHLLRGVNEDIWWLWLADTKTWRRYHDFEPGEMVKNGWRYLGPAALLPAALRQAEARGLREAAGMARQWGKDLRKPSQSAIAAHKIGMAIDAAASAKEQSDGE